MFRNPFAIQIFFYIFMQARMKKYQDTRLIECVFVKTYILRNRGGRVLVFMCFIFLLTLKCQRFLSKGQGSKSLKVHLNIERIWLEPINGQLSSSLVYVDVSIVARQSILLNDLNLYSYSLNKDMETVTRSMIFLFIYAWCLKENASRIYYL